MEQITDPMQNIRAMHEVVARMKEVPVLPSEQPKDKAALQRVEFPEQGGVLTFIEGYEHPYKGFPYEEFVDKIDLMKKLGRAAISGFYHQVKRHWYGILLALPTLFGARYLVRSAIYSAHRVVERFRILKERYCDSVRELHFAFSISPKGESGSREALREAVRDIVCMFLENDNAYRFRSQFVLQMLDKGLLKVNPRKAFLQILSELKKRELTQEIKDTWTLLEYFVKYYLLFDKELLGVLRDAFLRLDVGLVKLDEGDWLYCAPRKDFLFKVAIT